jgi:hypothetical protein
LTETLIVFPLFLLLTFGLAQLALNNVAGILSRVAQYEAARAAWVWTPEARAGRGGVQSGRDVRRRIRLTVALAMAPVASGSFTPRDAGLTRDARRLVRAMADRFPSARRRMRTRGVEGINRGGPSLTRALGTASFGIRALRKLTHAYAATRLEDIRLLEGPKTIGARFTYLHFQAMPLVGPIFGHRVSLGRGTGRVEGYAQPITREYRLPRQPHDVQASVP